MEETGLVLNGGTTEKHQFPSQDNNTWPRPNLAPPEHKTRYVTLQEERRLVRTKNKQAKNEGQQNVSVCSCQRRVFHVGRLCGAN